MWQTLGACISPIAQMWEVRRKVSLRLPCLSGLSTGVAASAQALCCVKGKAGPGLAS